MLKQDLWKLVQGEKNEGVSEDTLQTVLVNIIGVPLKVAPVIIGVTDSEKEQLNTKSSKESSTFKMNEDSD